MGPTCRTHALAVAITLSLGIGACPGLSWAATDLDIFLKLGPVAMGTDVNCEGPVPSGPFAGQSMVGGFDANTVGSPVLSFQPVKVVKEVDGCSAQLFLILAQGGHFDTVTPTFVLKNTPLVTIELARVFVQSIAQAAGTLDKAVMETVTFNYFRMTLTDLRTGTRFCWDETTNRAC
jgi:type VI protein secretion system component Hcp